MIRKCLSLAALCLLSISFALGATWDEGVAAFQSGKFADAEKYFRTLVDGQPDAPQGHYMLGLSLLQQKQAAEALGSLERAVELAPEETSYRLVKAQAELANGDAVGSVKSLAHIDPTTLDAQEQAAWFQLLDSATRKFPGPESTSLLEKALVSAPDQRRLWIALARVTPRPERAFEAAAQAWKLDTRNDEIARWAVTKALTLAGSARGEDRADWYQKAAEIARPWAAGSPSAESHLLLGESLMGTRDYAAARQALLSATGAGGGSEAWYELGQCSLALKMVEESLRELDMALSKNPGTELARRIHASRGAALRRAERFEEAGDAFGRAGLEKKVAEMSKLAEMKAENEQFSEELRACERDLEEVEKLEEENEDMKGTAAWTEIERQREIVVQRCRHYFDADEEGQP